MLISDIDAEETILTGSIGINSKNINNKLNNLLNIVFKNMFKLDIFYFDSKGNSIVKVVPIPDLDSKDILPPSLVITCFT